MKKLLLLLLLSLGAIGVTPAHETRPAVVSITFAAPTYQVEIVTNAEALLAGLGPTHTDTEKSPNARRYDELRALSAAQLKRQVEQFAPEFLAGLVFEFDGARVTPSFTAVEVPATGDTQLPRLSTLRLDGQLPPGAREFRWSYARAFGDCVLKLREAGREQGVSVWLKGGEWSDPYVLGEGLRPRSVFEIAAQYISLGFTHILPFGLDHILFVLGLFLLSTRWRPLLVQVTAFTVAHSITLALAIYGVFSLPATIVEPLIAASIVYVAIENVFTSRLHAWRPIVVFGFGLLHGMGFAGVLSDIGLPRSESLTALITFNVGVELGQLAVIVLAYLAIGVWGGQRGWYRARVVVPASFAIAAIGLYWTVERVVG